MPFKERSEVNVFALQARLQVEYSVSLSVIARMNMNPPLHVEVVQKRESRASKNIIQGMVHLFLANFVTFTPGATLTENELEDNPEMQEHVQSISFCDIDHETEVVVAETELVYHIYRLDAFGAETDTMTDTGSGEEFAVADVWALPSQEFHGLWESLVYDSKLKEDTVRFVETAFEFAERGVDPALVGCNRLVLLHGPPGTGKTSLCRALAHKLAVRLGERFPRARLLEVSAHGLFSKWFAESGKLVARLFERVHEIAADPRLLAVVLLDEVESLAHARRAALAGCEPSDAVRAVNALLSQLDRLRRRPNALVLATSNVTAAIDAAFLDRADLARHVGPPSPRAAYAILRGCCAELAARGVLAPRAGERVYELRVLEAAAFAESAETRASRQLWDVARAAAAAGLSGRALRRLPFLAVALRPRLRRRAPDLPAFAEALRGALDDHLADAAALRDEPNPSHLAI